MIVHKKPQKNILFVHPVKANGLHSHIGIHSIYHCLIFSFDEVFPIVEENADAVPKCTALQTYSLAKLFLRLCDPMWVHIFSYSLSLFLHKNKMVAQKRLCTRLNLLSETPLHVFQIFWFEFKELVSLLNSATFEPFLSICSNNIPNT